MQAPPFNLLFVYSFVLFHPRLVLGPGASQATTG